MTERTLAHCQIRGEMAYHSHGHVFALKDGTKARCMGPEFCEVCKHEKRISLLIAECEELFREAKASAKPLQMVCLCGGRIEAVGFNQDCAVFVCEKCQRQWDCIPSITVGDLLHPQKVNLDDSSI